jgi:hypothetical protein
MICGLQRNPARSSSRRFLSASGDEFSISNGCNGADIFQIFVKAEFVVI